jgi:branched-chain amino acid transport system permease protein
MRFELKKNYAPDIRLIEHAGQAWSYGLLLLAALMAPLVLPPYAMAQLTFVLIYSLIGMGLVVLTGYTGLVSLGHAAFVAVGAYTQALLVGKGVPLPASLLAAGALAALFGVLVGLPALRLRGLYLAIATLAFGVIVEVLLARWESLTGGNSGLPVPKASLMGVALDAPRYYYLCLAVLLTCLYFVLNILRSPTGRAFKAIRDSEVSARSMGIQLAVFKNFAFALSALLAGLGGALYAHMIGYISPEQFGLSLSIELLTMVVIGGAMWLHGAFLGAVCVIVLPQAIALAKDYLPAAVGQQTGLQPVAFGLVILFFVLIEPSGLYGRWVKIRTYLENFPLCPANVFTRQRRYLRTERVK